MRLNTLFLLCKFPIMSKRSLNHKLYRCRTFQLGHSMSTHPMLNTLMSQNLMKIISWVICELKTPIFLVLRKSEKRFKSYDPFNFRVGTSTRTTKTSVTQSLFNLETSFLYHSFTKWKSFLN